MVRTKHLFIVIVLMLSVVFASSFFAVSSTDQMARGTITSIFATPGDNYTVASAPIDDMYARESLIAKVRDSLQNEEKTTVEESEAVVEAVEEVEEVPVIPQYELVTLHEVATNTIPESLPPEIENPSVTVPTSTTEEPLTPHDISPIIQTEVIE